MKPTQRFFNALPHEISAALRGELRCVVRRVKPQPPHGCSYDMNGAGTHLVCFQKQPDGSTLWVPPTPRSKDHRMPCPLGQPGTLLLGREGWRCSHLGDGGTGIVYKHDGALAILSPRLFHVAKKCDSPPKFRAACTMPGEFVRPECRFTVESVECKRACELTEEEAKGIGFERSEDRFWVKGAGGHGLFESFKKAAWFSHELKHGSGSWETDWVWVVKVKREGGGE